MSSFQTKDLYFASYLYAKGAKFIRVERNGRQCYFIFEDNLLCEELQQGYFSRRGEVVGKDFSDAIRTLKDLLFSN